MLLVPLLDRNIGMWTGLLCLECKISGTFCALGGLEYACTHLLSLGILPNLLVELGSEHCLKSPFWNAVSWDTCLEDRDLWLVWFRSNSGTKSIYKGSSCDSSTFTNAEHTPSSLSRRLIFSKSNEKDVDSGQKEDAQSPRRTRFHDKSRKIRTGTQSISSLHRGIFFVGKRSCLSNLGKNRKNKRSMQVDKKNTHRSKLPTFARTNGILHRTSSQCKIVHEANPVTSFAFLETINNKPTNNSSLQQTCSGTSPILAKQRKSVERENLLCTRLHKGSDNWCFHTRLWRSLTRSNMSGNLVCAGGQKAHQVVRTKSSISDHQTLSSTSARSHSVNSLRQHISGSVFEQGGGNSVAQVMLSDMGHMASSKGQ